MTKIKNFMSLCWAMHFMEQLKAAGKPACVSFEPIVGQYQVEWED